MTNKENLVFSNEPLNGKQIQRQDRLFNGSRKGHLRLIRRFSIFYLVHSPALNLACPHKPHSGSSRIS
jgi:hypothetical protein